MGFVLLIACGNVAILFLQRAMRRSRDFSVRLALGAGRSRITRQILIESLLVSGLAGVLGWWIAPACVRGYAFAQAGGSITAVLSYTIDSRLLLYMLAVSTGSGLLVGLPAALWITRSNINHTLKDHGRSATAGARATLFSDLVIAAEVGLALIVLSGAGLMARSLVNVYAANIGVNTSNVLTMSLFIPRQHYEGEAQQISFYQRLIARLEVLAGVQSVAIASVPPTEAAARAPYAIADALPMEGGAQPTVARMAVSPGYFQTMEAPIVSGREFGEFDGPSNIPVAIVNEAFARRTWPADQALGKRLALFRDGVPWRG